MTILFHDFEGFNHLALPKVGTAAYARHPTCEALLCAYAFDDAPVQQWVPAEGEPMPADLREAMEDPYVVKSAWNAPMEWSMWTHCLGIKTPHTAWRDTMVMALTLSLPGSLGAASRIMGLPEDKAKSAAGKRLIRTFCGPVKPTKTKPWTRNSPQTEPEKWAEFKEYNRLDVEAERAIYHLLSKWDLPPHEWALWHIDRAINERGLPINLAVVKNAIEVADYITEDRLAKMRDITKLGNPNSGPQLLAWLQEAGYPFLDLKKGHVERAIEKIEKKVENPSELEEVRDVLDVLKMRQEVSKASVKKYHALERATTEDGLLRNSLQFAAAGRTWRWGGRIYQPQNLARPDPKLEKTLADDVVALEHLDPWSIEQCYPLPMNLLSSCVRPVVQAPEGCVLIDVDLNAIENRMLGWMAEDKKILDVFWKNRDPYIDFACYLYRQEYDALMAAYKAGEKLKRQMAKPGVLGCGYRLGPGEAFENEQTGEIEATGLLGYAWNMGVKNFTFAEAKHSVEVWRNTFRDAVAYWTTIERAAHRTVRTGVRTSAGPVDFMMDGHMLKMRLPSGRFLYYHHARIQMARTPWGADKMTLTYLGLDTKNQWSRIKTHGGKLTENADQAMSRDILAHGIRIAVRRGLDICLHVHDQIVGVSREDRAEAELAILKDSMVERQRWSHDLPLAVAGSISKVFLKD